MKREKILIIINLLLIIALCISIGIILVCEVQKSSTMSPNQIYSQSLNSVVEIKASSENVGDSYGSAVFLTQDGMLVTNAHVVTFSRLDTTFEFDEYNIRFSFEEDYRPVKLIAYDSDTDIAFLKIVDDDIDFVPVSLSTSSVLKSGDKVYAVGNTSNYGISISEGMVGVPSVKMEYSNKTRDVIQCSITIADGNSGGALLNDRGELVGLTTFRTKDSYGNTVYGIAYCIPIDVINQIEEKLIP